MGKSNFKKTETQDAGGNVAGSFTIALPDGLIQTTTYTADHTNGFIAEVTYSWAWAWVATLVRVTLLLPQPTTQGSNIIQSTMEEFRIMECGLCSSTFIITSKEHLNFIMK